MPAGIVNWDAQGLREVRPDITGATAVTEQLTVTRYEYGPSSTWEEHEHPEDQVTIVISGGPVTFECGGETVEVAAGQVALIPGGVPHSARLGDQGAVTINVFPPRQYRP